MLLELLIKTFRTIIWMLLVSTKFYPWSLLSNVSFQVYRMAQPQPVATQPPSSILPSPVFTCKWGFFPHCHIEWCKLLSPLHTFPVPLCGLIPIALSTILLTVYSLFSEYSYWNIRSTVQGLSFLKNYCICEQCLTNSRHPLFVE